MPSVNSTRSHKITILLSRKDIVAVADLGVFGSAGNVTAEEVDVNFNLISRPLHKVAEVYIGVASKVVLPTEALSVGTISIRKRDAHTDLISIAF